MESVAAEHAAVPPAEQAVQNAVPEKQGLISPLFVDVFGGVSSMVAGGVTAWRLIEERAHKNLSSLGLTEDIKHAREAYGSLIRDRVKSGLITPTEGHQQLQAAVKKFESQMDERFRKAGVGPVWKKLDILRDHQKWEVAITAIAVTGIALGSVLLLTKGLFAGEDKQKLDGKNGNPLQK